MKSLTYWHPSLYSFFIKLSYRRSYSQRYLAISKLIEKYGSVTDVCCGDCKIYDFLKEKKVDYIGLDFNPGFVEAANKKGIKAKK